MLRTKGVFLKVAFSSLLLFITTIGVGMTLEEIKEITKGKGVFNITITNIGKYAELVRVSVYVVNPPLGCEGLRFGMPWCLRVETKETKTIELPVPLVSIQGWKWLEGDNYNIEPYDNTDNLLPLSEACEVVVKVENSARGMEFDITGRDHSSEYRQSFKADYLSGTRFIELPQEVSFAVNFDPVSSSRSKHKPFNKSTESTSQWLKDLLKDEFDEVFDPTSFK